MDAGTRMRHIEAGIKRRYWKEKCFKGMALAAVLMALGMLVILFITIIGNGYTAFQQTHICLPIHFDAAKIDPQGTRARGVLSHANYSLLVKQALSVLVPEVNGRRQKRDLYSLVSPGAAFQLRDMVLKDASLIGTSRELWLPADDDVDMFVKGYIKVENG